MSLAGLWWSWRGFRVSLLPSVQAEHIWEHNVTRTANLPYLLLSIWPPHHTPIHPHPHTHTHTLLFLQKKQSVFAKCWFFFYPSLLNCPICCVFVLWRCITVAMYTVIIIYVWRRGWDLSPCRGRRDCLWAELSYRCLVSRMSDKPWFNRRSF